MIVLGGTYFMGYTVYRQTQELTRTLGGAINQFEGDLVHFLPGESLDRPEAATMAATQSAATEPAATEIAPATTIAAAEPSPRQWLAERLIQLREDATEFLLSDSFVKGAGGVAGGVVSSTFGVIGDVAVVISVGLFFAIHPSLYAQGLVRLLPIPRRKRAALILAQVGTQLQWWFVGQLCSMFSIGIVTYLGLKLLGVPMAVTLAMLAGLMNFVPNFGPLIAAAPAVVLAFAPRGDQTELRPALAGWVIVMYIIIQLLEGWVITPFFQQRAVELPPALIIISQVVFALFFGPIGLILATPILAATIVLVRMIYVEDILGDSGDSKKNRHR
jgi:predicted PurR-regulated permease PerM